MGTARLPDNGELELGPVMLPAGERIGARATGVVAVKDRFVVDGADGRRLRVCE